MDTKYKIVNGKIEGFIPVTVLIMTFPDFVHEKFQDNNSRIQASEYIRQWSEVSEIGQWLKGRATDSKIIEGAKDFATLQQQFALKVLLPEKDVTFFNLKWGSAEHVTVDWNAI